MGLSALGRLLGILCTLWIVSIVVFGLQHLLPGDPAVVLAGEDRSPETVAAIRERWKLDEPVVVQYGYWLARVVQGDLGESMRLNMSVAALLAEKLPVTLQLATMALLLAVAMGVTGGILAAARPDSWIDQLANLAGLIGLSIPNFWLGILLIMLVSVQWGLLPASGYVSPFVDPIGNLKAMIMPAFVLATGVAAVLMRHTRSAMLEVLGANYVRTARAKGLAEYRVLLGHALRNAMLPVITVAGDQAAGIVNGAVIVESIFGWPGVGKLMIDSIIQRDFAIIQASIFVTATLIFIMNIGIDLAYAKLDPRVRQG